MPTFHPRDLSHQKYRELVSCLSYPCWRLMRVHSYFVALRGSFEFCQSTTPSQVRHLPRLKHLSAAGPSHLRRQLPREILMRDLESGDFSLVGEMFLRCLPLNATLLIAHHLFSWEYRADSNDHDEYIKGDLLSWFNCHVHLWAYLAIRHHYLLAKCLLKLSLRPFDPLGCL